MSKTEPGSPTQRTAAGPIRFYQILLCRGVLGVIFGVATIFWPRDDSNPLDLEMPMGIVDGVIGCYLLATVVLLGWQSRHPGVAPRLRVFAIIQAVVALLAAIGLLTFTGDQQTLQLVVGAWALLNGLLEMFSWLEVRGRYRGAQDFVVTAGLFLVLAAVLFFVPRIGALSVLGLTGAVALMSGVLFVLGGLTARRLVRTG
ncbi:hypothetical protein LWF01_17595 [Saxibacter everestensis]|uniref:DUF308 domain-containing protein n=1 Tax=Saxibacter everestensis TaxID=2909229 RepID=A0ABY8QU29_9MICO|nr:hypothetical protein LWF01_17595 [Brevibacteriaceae bacterium ZFBP1038]